MDLQKKSKGTAAITPFPLIPRPNNQKCLKTNLSASPLSIILQNRKGRDREGTLTKEVINSTEVPNHIK